MSASYAASTNPIYIDTQNETFIEQAKVANQSFLISDDLPNINWKISKESKEIAGFPVQKAVAFLNDEYSTRILAWYSPKLTYKTGPERDRKSTRLNSSHVAISYAVFCLKK